MLLAPSGGRLPATAKDCGEGVLRIAGGGGGGGICAEVLLDRLGAMGVDDGGPLMMLLILGIVLTAGPGAVCSVGDCWPVTGARGRM